MPVVIVWGNDTSACEKAIEKIINDNISKSWGNLNLSKLDGNDPQQVLQVFDEIQTPPMGGGSRVVLLKNNPLFNIKNDMLTDKFESNISNIPNSSYLILQNTQKPDARIKNTKLLKKLVKQNIALEKSYSLPDFWDSESQINYIKEKSKLFNIKLDSDAAVAIIEAIGMDSTRLNKELEKTAIYLEAKGGSSKNEMVLTEIDVKELFNDHQSNIFKILDFLFANNIQQSLIEINSIINKGEPPLRLLAGLISQLRIHTIVLLLSQEKDSTKVSKIAGLTNPKRIFYIKKKVSNCSPKYLINIMIRFLNIESLLKKGNNPINVFTENLTTLK